MVHIVFPDGETAGYAVMPWNAGQQLIGPFVAYNAAVQAAISNTDGLAVGQQLRQMKRR